MGVFRLPWLGDNGKDSVALISSYCYVTVSILGIFAHVGPVYTITNSIECSARRVYIIVLCVSILGNSSGVVLQVRLHPHWLLWCTTYQVEFQEVNASMRAQRPIYRPWERFPACCRGVWMAEAAAVCTTDCWRHGRLARHTGLFGDGVLRGRMGFHGTSK